MRAIGFSAIRFWRNGRSIDPPDPPEPPMTKRILSEDGSRIIAENGDYIEWE